MPRAKYFVSYVWAGPGYMTSSTAMFGNTVMELDHPIRSEEQIAELTQRICNETNRDVTILNYIQIS